MTKGSPSQVVFNLDGTNLDTLENEDFKFLGSLITYRNSSGDVYQYVRDIVTTGIENIDGSLVRDEYKLKMYADYFLPSIRYHLTVNEITDTYLKSLDALTNRYLKKWSRLARPATLAFIHMPECLNIMSVSDLYYQAHSINYARMKSVSDSSVIHCLDSALERESTWTRKKSVLVKSQEVFETVNSADIITLPHLKQQIKDHFSNERSLEWQNHVQTLAVQGKFFELAALESKCVDWKSIIYNLPHKVARFLMNALTDTLNTRTNLVRWGKMISDKCKKCNNKETLHHVLNACSIALDEGRYTWRHDNILLYLVETIQKGLNDLDESVKISTDLNITPWGKTGISTIPIQCTQTTLIPDICVYWQDTKKLTLIELSVPFETNVTKAHNYKESKYAHLVTDLESKGYKVKLHAIEIGSRGHITPQNKTRLKSILKEFGKPITFKLFRDTISKLSVISSVTIYYAKDNPKWEIQTPLQIMPTQDTVT